MHEYFNPADIYGKPFLDLERWQQIKLMAYVALRQAEEGGAYEDG